MAESTVTYRPRWRAIVGNLLASAIAAGGAGFVAGLIRDTIDDDQRVSVKAIALALFLVLVAVILLARAIGALRTPHCRSCHDVLASEHAWFADAGSRSAIEHAVETGDVTSAWSLTRGSHPPDGDLVVVAFERCPCTPGAARVQVSRQRGSKSDKTLLRWRPLSEPEQADLAAVLAQT